MMLWDVIRNFFVQYIFGGVTSYGEVYGGMFGAFSDITGENIHDLGIYDVYFKIDGFFDGSFPVTYINVADYLSTTAAILVISLLCVAMGLAVVWLFKTIYRLVLKWAL